MSTPLKKGKKTLNFFLPLNYHWKYYQAYCWDDINNPAYDRPNPQFHEDPLYWLPSSFQNLSNNTDRNGANKKNTNVYTHSPNTQRKITIERVSWCENKWYPTPPPPLISPNPPFLWGKSEPPPTFFENFENSKLPLWGDSVMICTSETNYSSFNVMNRGRSCPLNSLLGTLPHLISQEHL